MKISIGISLPIVKTLLAIAACLTPSDVERGQCDDHDR